jgi:hypothetical protein
MKMVRYVMDLWRSVMGTDDQVEIQPTGHAVSNL